MKCLVVDESATTRRILANAARDAGGDEVVEAVDGADALARWEADHTLVVTGWLTPAMTGPELVRRLRARAEAEGLRVMMVTSRDRAAQVEEARTAGVDGYLVKPFTTAELTRRLRALCAPAVEMETEPGPSSPAGGETPGPVVHAPHQARATTLDRAA
jgi:two-component system, chemotaxis family, chemotaxis protein CheY